MIKTTLNLALVVAIAGLLASSAYAGPILLSDAQMDGVAAGSFVCPVISGKGVVHNAKFFSLPVDGDPSGYYSFGGPTVSVPQSATNTLDNGAPGSPFGPFAAPGDRGYTAIWYIP
jgi:hypothetical protein